MNAVLKKIKEQEQDFEWYPTTDRMLRAIKKQLENHRFESVLDVGAGDGRALRFLCPDGTRRAIEKCEILQQVLVGDCMPAGSDFHETSLIAIKADVVFSNPPYSEFETWAERIIREANADLIYLIVPERWKKSESIQDALRIRQARASVLLKDDFSDAARRSRATVHVIEINLRRDASGWSSGPTVDPFDLWFEREFKLEADRDEPELEETVRRERELVPNESIVDLLVRLHDAETDELRESVRTLSGLSSGVFKTLQLERDQVCSALKSSLIGLRAKYWQELFRAYKPITSRLTNRYRQEMLDRLSGETSIEFTRKNVMLITIWAVKNATVYFDRQLCDLVEALTERAGINLYKSNHRTFGKEDWRYKRKPEDLERYCLKLDYRFVLSWCGTVSRNRDWSVRTDNNNLCRSGNDLIEDLLAVASNLGFRSLDGPRDRSWVPGEPQEFVSADGTIIARVTGHIKGSLHLKINTDLLRKLNVEFGRLKGWLRDWREAASETDCSDDVAREAWGSNLALLPEVGQITG